MRRTPLWWRFSSIILGLLILFWLPIEDRSTISILIFSALICALSAVGVLTARDVLPERRRADGEQSAAPIHRSLRYGALLVWLIAGLGVTVVALQLMAIKTGLHGHGTPDYTTEQMMNVFSLAPLWVFLGLVIGLMAIFWKKSSSSFG